MNTQADTRWLTAEEQKTWRSLSTLTMRLSEALDRQLQRDSGMPHAYYMILAMLSEAPDRSLRMSDLAKATSTSQSRLSHAVSRLEELGWVSRRRCGNDGRGSIAWLTDEGMATLVAAAPGHVAQVRHALFDKLTPEQVEHLGAACDAALMGLR